MNTSNIGTTISESRKCPIQFLSELAESENVYVRMMVAVNPQTDKAVLEKLSVDYDPDVRYMSASSSYLPVHLLWKLKNDDNLNVRWRAELTLRRLGVIR